MGGGGGGGAGERDPERSDIAPQVAMGGTRPVVMNGVEGGGWEGECAERGCASGEGCFV